MRCRTSGGPTCSGLQQASRPHDAAMVDSPDPAPAAGGGPGGRARQDADNQLPAPVSGETMLARGLAHNADEQIDLCLPDVKGNQGLPHADGSHERRPDCEDNARGGLACPRAPGAVRIVERARRVTVCCRGITWTTRGLAMRQRATRFRMRKCLSVGLPGGPLQVVAALARVAQPRG